MSLPPSFNGMPIEEQSHYYRNVCLEFKKTIQTSKDPELLLEQVDRFLSASREVQWPHETSAKYHKDEAEKAVQKVANEFRRYLHELEGDPEKAQNVDLLNALKIVESLIDQLKVR